MSSWIGAPLDREALRAEAEAREHFEKLDAEQDAGTQFLTDIEAGKMVKRNSETIARWRRGEGLRFVPGRPCLIERKDLLAFLEARKCAKYKQPWKSAGPIAATSNASPEELAWVRDKALRWVMRERVRAKKAPPSK
jgi:hypothetical protein